MIKAGEGRLRSECGIELRKLRTVPTLRIEIPGQLQRECQSLEDEAMVDEQKKDGTDPEFSNTSYAVPRREQRLPVPAVYQRYIHLKVKIDNVFVPSILHNFSGIGILFESQGPFEIESYVDCVISIFQALSREIAFGIRVKHCEKKDNAFYVGAAIETADNATWFNIFKEVHDFIMLRKGDVY
jgi:hypothetical protein